MLAFPLFFIRFLQKENSGLYEMGKGTCFTELLQDLDSVLLFSDIV
jgi:hypothetical protein